MRRPRSQGSAFVAVLLAAVMGGCSSDLRDPPAMTLAAPSPGPVDSVALEAPAEARPDWRPYGMKASRTGQWEGRSAWGHPPNHPAPAAPQARADHPATEPAPSADWATRWVPPSDAGAFEDAMRAARSGGEGRWRTSAGDYGVAAFAGKVGQCTLVEVMLSSDPAGLPIRSRGTITDCAASGGL